MRVSRLEQGGRRQYKGTPKGSLCPAISPFRYFLIRARRKRRHGDNKLVDPSRRAAPRRVIRRTRRDIQKAKLKKKFIVIRAKSRERRKFLHKVAYVMALSNPRRTALICSAESFVLSGIRQEQIGIVRKYSPQTQNRGDIELVE